MKSLTRSSQFSEAIKAVIIVNCLLGVRAFEYPRGHLRPALSLIYFLVVFAICCGGFLNIEAFYANMKLMKLEYILYRLMHSVIVLSVILKMSLGWWNTKKSKVCYKKISKIDDTLRQLGVVINYDKLYFAIIGIMSMWFSIVIVVNIFAFNHLKIRTNTLNSIYMMVVYTISLTVDFINIFEFYILSRCLHIKFGFVNHLLCNSLTNLSIKEMKLGIFGIKDYTKIMDCERSKNVLSMKVILQMRRRVQSRISVSTTENPDPVVFQIKSHFPFQLKAQSESKIQSEVRNRSESHTSAICQKHKLLLPILKQVHLELCKVSKLVCTTFGVQIAWEIGIIIMFLTGGLYNFYNRYIMNQQHVVPEQTLLTMIMCFINITKAIFLNRACKNAADEGNKTVTIIHTIYGCNIDTDMQEEMQQFGIQILQSPVIFSVFGFTMGNHILSMILKTVSTYLVIMIQMSSSLESNTAIQHLHF
ncbi:hypothetical protein PUN28_011131 [Cardiocondyla obscurior]|uniref:Gustatory receptor n=1 Tax=Cardiocondyla obscurior TaxID=286306 RepID=A0AAW2FKW4_9HYME